jgi:hypothetical protein
MTCLFIIIHFDKFNCTSILNVRVYTKPRYIETAKPSGLNVVAERRYTARNTAKSFWVHNDGASGNTTEMVRCFYVTSLGTSKT